MIDAESQTTSYTYNSRGLKLSETYPDHVSGATIGTTGYGVVSFSYDNGGRLTRKQDQLGDTCSFNYDVAGRMTSRNYRTYANSPSGTIADTDSMTFDRVSRMLTAVSGRYTNTVTCGYDLVGRKATESLTTNGRTYSISAAYNSRDELVKYTYPDASIQDRTFHPTGALHQVKLDGTTVSTRTYDAGFRLTSDSLGLINRPVSLGNNVSETRGYANDKPLNSIDIDGTGTAIGDLSF